MDRVSKDPKMRHPERIALQDQELTKIDAWRAQVVAAQRGVRLSRSDMVRWLIEAKTAELTAAEALAVGRRHFDEGRYLQDVTREFHSRKALGEKKILGKILTDGKACATKTPRLGAKGRDEDGDSVTSLLQGSSGIAQ